MNLPRGVTGFSDISRVEFLQFKRVCINTARLTGSVVTAVDSCENKVAPNFHSVTMEMTGTKLSIICNRYYSLVAYIEPLQPGECVLRFLDVIVLTESFRTDGSFEVLTNEFLSSPIEGSVLSQLDSAEMEQVRYWNPKRIGEVIFNFWD